MTAHLTNAAIRRQKKKRALERKRKEKEQLQERVESVNQVDKVSNFNTQIEYVPEALPEELAIDIRRRFDPFYNKDENEKLEHQGESEQQQTGESSSSEHEDTEISMSVTSSQTLALSKKRLRRLQRISLAELKQLARRPEVVEWEDVTAKDPIFLVYLKSLRNYVPVPKHWSRKRKYLAGKRGFIKPPFELPAFIKDTGIMEARESTRKQDTSKSLKVKARERMRPKLGKLMVDYQKLYDAFFKYQTKPPLTKQGDLYYEGKEFEARFREKRAGVLSEEARYALGMGPLAPPPWLYNMQKYGAPPSYPNLKIPGLNAPIPEGAQWGYHAGGWGKPPMDEAMRSLFEGGNADQRDSLVRDAYLVPLETMSWGEFEPEEDLEE